MTRYRASVLPDRLVFGAERPFEIRRPYLESIGLVAADAPAGAEDALSDTEIRDGIRAFEARLGLTRYRALVLDWSPPPFADTDYYLWPDGTIARGDPLEVFAGLREDAERERDLLDDAPLPVGDGTYSVVSAAYAHWGGLFHRVARHRADGAAEFSKVVLRRVATESRAPAGIYEIATAEELDEIASRRMDRHNAVHNARHIVEAEYLPLIDAMETAYRAVEDWWADDDPDFSAAAAAWRAYDLSGRMAAEAAPERQVPTAERIETLRAIVIARLETEAAQRITALTGQRQTWLALQTASAYDASDLLRIVADGRAEIEAAETAEEIEAAAAAATALVKVWTFRLSIRVSSRRLRAGRKVRLVMMASGVAYVRIALYRDSPGPGDGITPLAAEDASVALPRNRFGAEGIQTLSALLTVADSVPDAAEITAEIILSHTEGGPEVVRAYHSLGTLPVAAPSGSGGDAT